MEYTQQVERRVKRVDLWAIAGAFAIAILMIVAATQVEAQTFTVLHQFTGGADGSSPYGGLSLDRSGNILGTATYGANQSCADSYGVGCGTLFKLTRSGSGWLFSPLYAFQGGNDGANPAANLTIARDGTVYGTTNGGGGGNCTDSTFSTHGCGTVFRMRPMPNRCTSVLCAWNETVLYRFTGGADGNNLLGQLAVDAAGNVYGTTAEGGAYGGGEAFQLAPAGSSWTKSAIHTFGSASDGLNPTGGLTLGPDGDLYGNTIYSADGLCSFTSCGTLYQLTPSGSGWSENILYVFHCGSDGCGPQPALIFDPAGNYYGTSMGEPNAVFQMSPSNGGWNFSAVHDFDFGGLQSLFGSLAMDAAGNLYGASYYGNSSNCVYGCGTVFKLTPSQGGWTYTLLYQFTGGADGGHPYGGVVVDADGNVYGTTTDGGANNCEYSGCGTLWKITP